MCLESKPLAEFIKDSRNKDGHGSWCRSCKTKKNTEWSKANPGVRAKYSQRWRQANPGKAAESKRAYRSDPENKSAELEQKRIWSRKNKEKARLYAANRRARKRNSDKAMVTESDFAQLYSKPCIYCGNKSEQIDHVVPLARGGRHAIGNLAPACTSCNQSKGSKLIVEWKYRDKV